MYHGKVSLAQHTRVSRLDRLMSYRCFPKLGRDNQTWSLFVMIGSAVHREEDSLGLGDWVKRLKLRYGSPNEAETLLQTERTSRSSPPTSRRFSLALMFVLDILHAVDEDYYQPSNQHLVPWPTSKPACGGRRSQRRPILVSSVNAVSSSTVEDRSDIARCSNQCDITLRGFARAGS